MRFIVVEPLLMIQKTYPIFFPILIVAKTTQWQSSHCIAEHGVAHAQHAETRNQGRNSETFTGRNQGTELWVEEWESNRKILKEEFLMPAEIFHYQVLKQAQPNLAGHDISIKS